MDDQELFATIRDELFTAVVGDVLDDMVRVIRTFRPLVISSRFTGTASDGHGQHQLAGYLTPLAFRAAADPRPAGPRLVVAAWRGPPRPAPRPAGTVAPLAAGLPPRERCALRTAR